MQVPVGAPRDETKSRATGSWPPMHWLDHPDFQPFVDDFWRARYGEDDVAMYERFLEIIRLSKFGLNGDQIGRQLHMNNVRKYLTGEKISFLSFLRREHDRLGTPEPGHKWIPLTLKPRGTPGDEWVQVPESPLTFSKIDSMIKNLPMGKPDPFLLDEFGFKSADDLRQERTDLFGFLLGAAIGDAGKHPKGESRFLSKSLSLVLSKAKSNSFRFGQFVALCSRTSLGLDMHRISDAPRSESRFTDAECYRWISQASPLVGWLIHGCLGLNEGELTTYNPLRMEWLPQATPSFKIGVLQGVSESDGWVDAGDDTVCIVSSPNSALFSNVLASLGLRHRVDHQNSLR